MTDETERGNNRPCFVKGLKRIRSVHLVGFIGLMIIIGLFFAGSKCVYHSGVTLMDMRGFQLVGQPSEVSTEAVRQIENNFKKLSFTLDLSALAESPGFITFRKEVDLKGRGDYQNLRFFVSVEIGEMDEALLSFLEIRIYLDETLAWSVPVSEIESPTFVEQDIEFLNSKELSEISFSVGCDPPSCAEPIEVMEHSIDIAFEYLDIQ